MTRSLAYTLAAIVAVVLVVALAWSFDPFGRRKAAEAKAATAEQQVKVEEAATQAVEQVHRVEIRTHQITQEAIEHVQRSEGADTPLPPAVAASVRAGIGGLRDGEAGDDQPARDAEGAVPTR